MFAIIYEHFNNFSEMKYWVKNRIKPARHNLIQLIKIFIRESADIGIWN